jgi:hypothetical protein
MEFQNPLTCLSYQISAKAPHKWTHLKIVAYHKSHRRLQQYQCPALIIVCQHSEDGETETHYGVSQYHQIMCRCVL